MTFQLVFQIILFLTLLLVAAWPLGPYVARIYQGDFPWAVRGLIPIEKQIYRVAGINPQHSMHWKEYAGAVLILSFFSFGMTYAVQRLQHAFPLNPNQLPALSSDSAFNTAVSFVTNTNWQGYGGETTMSHATQMLALTVQNFVSAAVGMAVLVALIRGLMSEAHGTLGNFWVDLVRGVLYVLLPLSSLLALLLVSQGVVQTLAGTQEVALLEPIVNSDGSVLSTQTIAVGPAASQVAIKQLGTNGGGFFNVNSAHPLENPTPLSNFLQLLSILLLPAALCLTFGELVRDRRQGWTLLCAMLVILIPALFVVGIAEQQGNPRLSSLHVDQSASLVQSGGNMEGKETRFGVVGSSLWAVATTAASNGSVNSMHDSYTPIGGLVPMWMIQLGEIVFGGVGSGLYGMLVFAILAVFISGLMVGKTPEYLGKKIRAREIQFASLAILFPSVIILIGTAVGVSVTPGRETIFNPGAHGFSEVLYAFSSAGNNNGSAFAGLGANTPFYNGMLGLAMLIGRFWVLLPVLAIAGSLANQQRITPGPGTFPTHTPMFVLVLVSVVILVGALTYLPALALGPIVEQLQLNEMQGAGHE